VKDGKGKYGRILGQFKLEDGTILNENMISEHHAVAYHGQSKEEIAEGHIANREFINL
jgi:endonuclease YncB( thermonuclease family)